MTRLWFLLFAFCRICGEMWIYWRSWCLRSLYHVWWSTCTLGMKAILWCSGAKMDLVREFNKTMTLSRFSQPQCDFSIPCATIVPCITFVFYWITRFWNYPSAIRRRRAAGVPRRWGAASCSGGFVGEITGVCVCANLCGNKSPCTCV